MSSPTYQAGRYHPYFRLQNAVGRFFDRIQADPLPATFDEGRILKAAMARTGLHDFGDEDFREPMRAMLASARDVRPHLTWHGRKIVHDFVFNGLCKRLLMHKALKDHPEILEQPVRRPLMVAALPRTGTTVTFNQLAEDPAARPLLMWESIFFTPWKSQRTPKSDPRIRATAMGVWLAKKVIPEYFVAHELRHDKPEECHWLLSPSFIWPPFVGLPAYAEWLRAQPESTYDRAYLIYRRALQMLHWQRPAHGHWALKSIIHIWAMPSMLRVIPEMSVVHTHRNMREVIPSFCSMVATLVNGASDRIRPDTIGPVILSALREALERDMRGRASIDPARICDIRYEDVVKDPVGTIRGVYEKFNYAFSPELERRLQEFHARSRSAPRQKHIYSLEQFNLTSEAIDEAFADYHRQFGLAT